MPDPFTKFSDGFVIAIATKIHTNGNDPVDEKMENARKRERNTYLKDCSSPHLHVNIFMLLQIILILKADP